MKKSGGYMHEGMTRKCPPGDSGMRPPKGNVSDDAVRTSTAPTPPTLGPRTA